MDNTKKISEFDPATGLTGNEILVVVQDGVTKYTAASNITATALLNSNGFELSPDATSSIQLELNSVLKITDNFNGGTLAEFGVSDGLNYTYLYGAESGISTSAITLDQSGITINSSDVGITVIGTLSGHRDNVTGAPDGSSLSGDGFSNRHYTNLVDAVSGTEITVGSGLTVGTKLTFTNINATQSLTVTFTNPEVANVTYGNTLIAATSSIILTNIGDTVTITKLTSDTWFGTASGTGLGPL